MLFLKNIIPGLACGAFVMFLIATLLFRYIMLRRKNKRLRIEHEVVLQLLENEKSRAVLQSEFQLDNEKTPIWKGKPHDKVEA